MINFVVILKKLISIFNPTNQESRKRKTIYTMAGGSLAPVGVARERAEQYRGKVTAYVIIACIVAATGGSLFGYDVGISGDGNEIC